MFDFFYCSCSSRIISANKAVKDIGCQVWWSMPVVIPTTGGAEAEGSLGGGYS